MKREETKDNISIVNKNNIAIPLKGAVIMKGAIVTIKLILGNNGKLYRKVVKVFSKTKITFPENYNSKRNVQCHNLISSINIAMISLFIISTNIDIA